VRSCAEVHKWENGLNFLRQANPIKNYNILCYKWRGFDNISRLKWHFLKNYFEIRLQRPMNNSDMLSWVQYLLRLIVLGCLFFRVAKPWRLLPPFGVSRLALFFCILWKNTVVVPIMSLETSVWLNTNIFRVQVAVDANQFSFQTVRLKLLRNY